MATSQATSGRAIIFHATDVDAPYFSMLKPLLANKARKTWIDTTVPVTVTELWIKAKERGASIVSTSERLLSLIYPDAKNPKISEYAGSLHNYRGIDILFVDPLKQLVTVNYGKFVLERYLSKVLAPGKWIPEPEFKWELFEPKNAESILDFFMACTFIACDIETVRDHPDRVISCAGFTGVQLVRGKIRMRTVVVPMDEEYNVLYSQLLLDTPVAKVFQNGKYDIAYFMRYNSPVRDYSFDTLNLFHSWLSELPKDLGFISGFLLRGYQFHKNDGKSGGKLTHYQYNAKDCYVTALCLVALLTEIPDYARHNYLQEFPLVFPCILSEHTGLKWDAEKADELRKRVDAEMETEKLRLGKLIDTPGFNPNSPPQVVKVWKLLGSGDVTNTIPAAKDKVASRHPLNKLIVDGIINYRENSKLRGSYFKEGISWNGRCFYALNPHGTDTGRLASRESQFWCGLQIQNIPRDGDDGDVAVKEAFVADADFVFGEADYAQAESRGTGYLSGDTALIGAVDNPAIDFHGHNASAFFGVPYDRIVKSTWIEEIQEWVHKTIDKALRDLSKRTNHGASYNMGPQVMLDTMGIAKVLKAKEILGLPKSWSAFRVCEYLLECFGKTYSVLRHDYQEWLKTTIGNTGLLIGPTGWTRKCFGSPSKNKRDLNSYVAHPSQSLNAMMLNKAYLKVFYNVWMKYQTDFKLCAQIHDSILFQYRKGHDHLPWLVANEMRVPIPVKDIFGITRELIVPVDVKGGATRWSDVKSLRKPREFKVA